MRITDLLERESDSFIARITSQAITALIRHLEPIWDAESVDEISVEALGNGFFMNHQEFLVIPLGDVPGMPPALRATLLIFDVMKGWSPHGGFGTERRPVRIHGKEYLNHVTLNILPKYKNFDAEWRLALFEAAKSFAYSQTVRQVFRHEVAHCLDQRKHKGRARRVPDTNPIGYFNSDAETNSYFTNLVAALQSAAEMADKGNPKAFTRLGFNGDPRDDFKNSLRHATDLSQVSEWMRALNPTQRKRVLKRFSTVHADVVAKVRAAEEKANNSPLTD